MSRKQILEMAGAALLFILIGLAAAVFRNNLAADAAGWEIAEIMAGQGTDNPASETVVVFSNEDFSKAVSRAVASHTGFKLRTKGRRPKNPEFNFKLLFFVNSASVIPSEIVTGGYEARVNTGLMLLDTRDGTERFSGGFNGTVPLAKEMVPQAIIDSLNLLPARKGDSRKNGGKRAASPENQAKNQGNAAASGDQKKGQGVFEGEVSEELRNAFLKAMDRALALGFDDAERHLRIQQLDDSELVKMLKSSRGCPSAVLLDVLNDRKPAGAFDYLVEFVRKGPAAGANAGAGAHDACFDERMKSAAILGSMGRREAVPVLIEFAENTEDLSSMMTALAPIAQQGGEQAAGYMFILSAGHISETIQKVASLHLKTMKADIAGWTLPSKAPESPKAPK